MKKLYQIFLLLSRGRQIALTVALFHFLTLFVLTSHHLISSRLRPPRPMVIKTIVQAAKRAALTTAAPPLKASTSPKPATKQIASNPKHSTTLAKSKIDKKSASVAATAPKKGGNSSVLKDITKSFDAIAIDEPKKENFSALNIPSRIKRDLPIIEEEPEDDADYGEYLIAFLQNSLDLPEYGEVKMEIEIDSFGKLMNCKILDSKSQKNETFLKNEISQLTFPIPHLSRFELSKRLTITFKNR